jgi:hypothetical protein
MKYRWVSGLLLAATIAAAALVSTGARADKRVALVVGNSAYQKVQRLNNPVNDARAVAEVFKAAGFHVVDVHHDLNATALRRTIRDFSQTTRDADIAVIYYAGHGIEVEGNNYVVPVDAKLEWDADIEDEAVSLDRMLRAIEPARRLRLIILDACRENPFIPAMKRTVATRSVGRGLARVEPTTSDTLIAFAAKAGSTAEDGDGKHSPFTGALLKHLGVPGLDVRFAFGRIRDEVLKITRNKQEPFVYGSLGGDIVAIVPALPEPPRLRQPAPDELTWDFLKDSTDAAALKQFVERFPTSALRPQAEARIAALAAAADQRIAAVVPEAAQEPKRLLSPPIDRRDLARAAARAQTRRMLRRGGRRRIQRRNANRAEELRQTCRAHLAGCGRFARGAQGGSRN